MPTRRKKSHNRPHTPKRLTPEQEDAERKAAFAAIRALFCQVAQPWRSCPRGYCRRHHCCIAEAGPGPCLKRHWPLLTPAEQKQAHGAMSSMAARSACGRARTRNGACAAFRRRISSIERARATEDRGQIAIRESSLYSSNVVHGIRGEDLFHEQRQPSDPRFQLHAAA